MGRPRIYADATARQRAFRERKRSGEGYFPQPRLQDRFKAAEAEIALLREDVSYLEKQIRWDKELAAVRRLLVKQNRLLSQAAAVAAMNEAIGRQNR